jgi:hypothetical protein
MYRMTNAIKKKTSARKSKGGTTPPKGPNIEHGDWHGTNHIETVDGPDHRELARRFARDRLREEDTNFPFYMNKYFPKGAEFFPGDIVHKSPSPKGLGRYDNIPEESLFRRSRKPSPVPKRKRSPNSSSRSPSPKTKSSPSKSKKAAK